MAKKLNLGCGPNWKKQYPNHEGLDIIDYGQKYVSDVLNIRVEKNLKYFCNFPENTYDEVMANHFIEHFDQDQLKYLFRRVYFILKEGGLFKFVVPHKDKDSAWRLSHKTFWCEGTIKWLGSPEADNVYSFGKWKIQDVITNSRKDIHAWLIKQKGKI